MNKVEIRLAKSEDKENVLKILDELIYEVNKKMGSTLAHKSNQKRYALYEKMLHREDIKIFVAQENGEIYGVAELYIIPILRRGYYQGVIEGLVVSKSMRGKGIGSALLKEIIDYCKSNNISVIKVNSGNELTEAHKFYESHGGKFTEKLFRFDLK